MCTVLRLLSHKHFREPSLLHSYSFRSLFLFHELLDEALLVHVAQVVFAAEVFSLVLLLQRHNLFLLLYVLPHRLFHFRNHFISLLHALHDVLVAFLFMLLLLILNVLRALLSVFEPRAHLLRPAPVVFLLFLAQSL